VVFTLLFALAEATSSIQTPIGYAKAIAAWFDRRRGLALGIAMSGVGLGGFVMPQLAQALIDRVGWRGAYLILGCVGGCRLGFVDDLYGAFPVKRYWFLLTFFVRSGKGRSSSRRLRSSSRSARKGSRDRNASGAWRLAALASLVVSQRLDA
jgi:MFS family permease